MPGIGYWLNMTAMNPQSPILYSFDHDDVRSILFVSGMVAVLTIEFSHLYFWLDLNIFYVLKILISTSIYLKI